ncbi:MAG: ABC transporter ATP-binding protein [Clostridiales bacterium]|nr:ABC transporter ATP-binding protein [Clostridia bacterium]MBQ6565079.1 ABC transporter ATP-binding protein [Clostridia bacterium]MCR4883414.1 ABC transporter ATP-binding protein [Clostridiales bacterium]
MLESRSITKKFGSKTAVDQVTVRFEPGHIYAVLGPNGSGKTTWMKMAAGLIKPTSGEVLFDGKPVNIESRKHIAYMSTEPYFYTWMTARDVGRYYEDFFEDFSYATYKRLLERMELTEDMKTSALSSGMMAKLKIAVTLARDAMVYMLDEPFNGIDLLARDEIRQTILERADESKVLLLSSHLVEEMEAIADKAVFIRKGQLVDQVDLEQLRTEKGISMADRYREIYGHEGAQA